MRSIRRRAGSTSAYRFGLDPQLSSLSHAGWAYWFLGYADQAALRSEEAVSLTRELGHPYLLSWASMFAAFSSVYRRDIRSARRNAEQTIAISGEHGHPLWLGGGLGSLGWVLGEEGEPDKAIPYILRGLAMLHATESRLGYLQTLSLLVETYRKAGRASEGLAVVDEGLALVQATECRMDEPELHRLRGELLVMQGGAQAAAEASFRHAIEVAEQHQARSWELWATTSLCRLWQKQAKAKEARRLLAAIYGWFTEGFDTPDLGEAKALLDRL